jgi:hypothetical protein
MQEKNETLEKNLEALIKKNKKLAETIREHTPVNVDFMCAQSGDIIMVYEGMPLHSVENPILEAKNIYSNVKDTGYKSFNVVFGLGLGYLFKRATIECKGKLVLYEPNLDILRATLEVVDFSNELSMPNVCVLGDIKEMKPLFMLNYYHGDYVGLQTLTPYRLKFSKQMQELTEMLQMLYRDSTINQSTVIKKAMKWSLAAVNNIFDVMKYPNMNMLKDRLKGVPAVCVSAGPSLEYAIDQLKEVQDKVFIVAVGQALKAIHKAGIKPHLVAVIENLNVSQQFEGISYLDDLTVIVQPMTHRAIYKLPVKRFMINFPLGDSIAKWFGRTVTRDVTGFPNRGTVSITAYYAAQHSGASPVMLTGQDLAYRDGKMYASNSSYEKLKYEISEDGKVSYGYTDETYEEIGKTLELTKEEFKARNEIMASDSIYVKGWNGEDLLTTNSYHVFLDNYIDIAERELPKTDQRVINCSEGGAFIKGLEHMPFKEALKEVNLDHGININAVIDEIFEDFNQTRPDYQILFNAIYNAINDLAEASDLAQKAMKIALKIQEELEKPGMNARVIDKNIDKLGKFDLKLVSIIKKTELINPFIQKELFEFSSTYARSSETEDKEDKIAMLKDNIFHSIKLYQAVISGAGSLKDLLPQVVEDNENLLNKASV